MKRTLLVVLAALLLVPFSRAQEFFVNADIVSSYMWRGQKLAEACVQPTIGFKTGGLTISAWGSTEFKGNHNEIDLTLTYDFKNFTIFFNDVYVEHSDERSNYFNYRAHDSGHALDFGIFYTASKKLPLKISWYTNIAGNDYKENNKRAWTSYLLLSYPFRVNDINIELEAGLNPWEGGLGDKFNVINLSLKATKEIRITDSFSLPIFGHLGTNPDQKKAYFAFGLTF